MNYLDLHPGNNKQEYDQIISEIPDLDEIIIEIYKTRRSRDLFGENGMLIRTLGIDNLTQEIDVSTLPKKYQDKDRKEVQTEVSEALEAIEDFMKDSGSFDKLLDVIMELGDVYYQRKIIEVMLKDKDDTDDAINAIDKALEQLLQRVNHPLITMDNIKLVIKTKMGARLYSGKGNNQGQSGKDKTLERDLCGYVLNSVSN